MEHGKHEMLKLFRCLSLTNHCLLFLFSSLRDVAVFTVRIVGKVFFSPIKLVKNLYFFRRFEKEKKIEAESHGLQV